MAARGFFRARLLFSCFTRNWCTSEIVPTKGTRKTLDNLLQSSKIVSEAENSTCTRKSVMDRDEGRENSQNGCKKLMETWHRTKKYLASFSWPFSVVCICSSRRPLRLQARKTRRKKSRFASKQLRQSVTNFAKAENGGTCKSEEKENHPQHKEGLESNLQEK